MLLDDLGKRAKQQPDADGDANRQPDQADSGELAKIAGAGEVRLIVVIMLAVALLSGFMSDTGTVAVLLPALVCLGVTATAQEAETAVQAAPPPAAGAELRNAAVAANPTIGGRSAYMALMPACKVIAVIAMNAGPGLFVKR